MPYPGRWMYDVAVQISPKGFFLTLCMEDGTEFDRYRATYLDSEGAAH